MYAYFYMYIEIHIMIYIYRDVYEYIHSQCGTIKGVMVEAPTVYRAAGSSQSFGRGKYMVLSFKRPFRLAEAFFEHLSRQ